MKTITNLLLAASVFVAFGTAASAQATIDFETSGLGASFAWTSWATVTMAPDANPATTGINTSAQAIKFTYAVDGGQWDGVYTDSYPEFTITKDNCIVKMMVYKSVASQIIFKLEKGTVAYEAKVDNTVTDEWEELTFDFTSMIGSTVNRIVIFADPRAEARVDGELVAYFDNITFNPSATSLATMDANGVSIYPNPTSGLINIAATQELSSIEITNIVGVTVKNLEINGLTASVNICDLAAGAYFVSVKQANGAISVSKIVKK